MAKRLKQEGMRPLLWIQRDLDGQSLRSLRAINAKRAEGFSDGLDNPQIQQKLTGVREVLSTAFEIVHPVPLTKGLGVDHYISKDKECEEYLEKWRIAVTNRLQEELDVCIVKKKTWEDRLVRELGLPMDQIEEMQRHNSFAARKIASFIGREELVLEAKNKIL